MSRPACGVCGASGWCWHLLHTGGDNDGDHNSSRAMFSVFPVVHHHEHSPSIMQQQQQQQQPPPGCLHEFQFFGHQDDDHHHESVAWLFDHPPPARDVEDDERSPADENHHRAFDPFGPRYNNPGSGNGLTFKVDARLGLGSGGGATRQTETAAASATIMSFCGSTFTDAASSRFKEPTLIDDSQQLQMPVDPSTEREIKLMRYKQKRMRRCYDKQIRYASRKSYAQVRPRVNGRFAKVTEACSAAATADNVRK